jgi:hypothetical protein
MSVITKSTPFFDTPIKYLKGVGPIRADLIVLAYIKLKK